MDSVKHNSLKCTGEENNVTFSTATQKEEMLGPTTRMRRNERSNMGFTDRIPYLLLEGEDSRRRWQDKDSLFVPY